MIKYDILFIIQSLDSSLEGKPVHRQLGINWHYLFNQFYLLSAESIAEKNNRTMVKKTPKPQDSNMEPKPMRDKHNSLFSLSHYPHRIDLKLW